MSLTPQPGHPRSLSSSESQQPEPGGCTQHTLALTSGLGALLRPPQRLLHDFCGAPAPGNNLITPLAPEKGSGQGSICSPLYSSCWVFLTRRCVSFDR